MAQEKLYIANWKIDAIRKNGIDRIMIPGSGIELTEKEAEPFVIAGALRLATGVSYRTGTPGEPVAIPKGFPHYRDLVRDENGSPTFRTIEDLKHATDEELMSKRWIGVKGVEQIREAIKEYDSRVSNP